MIVRIITCNVTPGTEAEFEAATKENHHSSLTEPGIFRFDVLRDSESRSRYYLYEVYQDQAAIEAHKKTGHYHVWRDAVASLMASDRSSVSCSVVAPITESAWGSG